MNYRYVGLLAPLVGAAVLISGCGKGNFSEKQSALTKNILKYPLPANPTHVDPALVQDGDTIDVTQQIFEGLVGWGEDNQVKPNLCSSWDIKNGGKTYIFHIRKGIKFSNGDDLTADNFKYAIERTTDPSLHSVTAADYLGYIQGVTQKLAGTAQDVSGVKVLDPFTLEIDIDQPRPYFLGDLTYPCSFAVDPKVSKRGQEMVDVKQMIGTGPFIATKYVEDQSFEMEANKSYHEGAPKIDGISRPIVKDASTRLNLYKAGQIDIVNLERGDVLEVKNNPELAKQLHFFNRPATWYIAFNTKVYPPFADRRVRQAFSMAIDTDDIVKNTLNGINDKATGILPKGVAGYRESGAKLLPYDVNQAKALLAQAGYADGSKMPSLQLYFRNDRPDMKIVAEKVQSDLLANLGVNCELRALDWTTYLDRNNKNLLPFYHMRWAADYLDPQDFLSILLTTHGPENHQYYSNPQVDALCAKADVMSADNPQRMVLYQQAEDLVLQDAAWLPIYFQKDAELISPRVSGMRESVFGHLPHTTTALSE